VIGCQRDLGASVLATANSMAVGWDILPGQIGIANRKRG